MPIYEYTCQACDKIARFALSYAEYDRAELSCPHCGSAQLKRRVSRVALGKTEDARLDSLMDDPSLAALDEEDPRSLGRFMRKMSHELGEDMGSEFNEVVERLEKGESPESIEQSLPDLGTAVDD